MLLALVLAASTLTPGERTLLEHERNQLLLTQPSREPAATFLIAGSVAGLGALGAGLGLVLFAAKPPEENKGTLDALATGLALSGAVAITCLILGLVEWRSVSRERESSDSRVSQIDRVLSAP